MTGGTRDVGPGIGVTPRRHEVLDWNHRQRPKRTGPRGNVGQMSSVDVARMELVNGKGGATTNRLRGKESFTGTGTTSSPRGTVSGWD